MAEATQLILNDKATGKLRSADDMERCIRVTNPSVWAVLAACVVLIAGLLAWGVFGSVTTSVTTTGTVVDGKAVCFLSAEDAPKVHAGDIANFGGTKLTVTDVAAVPVSPDEARDELGSSYLATTLIPGDWGYKVSFDGDTSKLVEGAPQAVSITVERVAPLSVIFESRE